ncbi:tyrosine-type recombinase/integrase [Verrucomicrobiota bacterium sgz303538]
MKSAVSPGTTNIALKILRGAFHAAEQKKLITENPASSVKVIRRTGEVSRRGFTVAELRQIIAAADGEWRGLIGFGLYTGQRLKDIALLTRRNIVGREIRLTTAKTGRSQKLPIAPPLARIIAAMPQFSDPDEPLFPNAYKSVSKTGRSGHLSNQFYDILSTAGLATPRSHAGRGKGRSNRRQMNELSFHSLRHTATTLLKSEGVSPAIVQEFIGHNSAAISRTYTHIPLEALQRAADTLPDIFLVAESA